MTSTLEKHCKLDKKEIVFFEKNAMLMKGLNVPSTGSTEFSFVMKVQNKIETLNTLPNEVKVDIINKKKRCYIFGDGDNSY